MNRTLYKTAMDKVTMSDEFEMEILEKADSIQQTAEKKNRKHIRLIPALTAATIFVAGTVTVSANGGFDWLKGMFRDDSFEITDEIAGMVAAMDNFSCENVGDNLKISPIGIIAEESTLYCMFHVDEMPKGTKLKNIKLQKVSTDNNYPPDYSKTVYDVDGNEVTGATSGFGMEYKDGNVLAVEVFPDYKAFGEGDRVTLKFVEAEECYEDEETGYSFFGAEIDLDYQADTYADVSFDLNMGNVHYLEKTYEEYTAIEVKSSKLFVEKMCISPLRVMISGKNIYCDSFAPRTDIQITFKDGTSVIASHFGGGGHAQLIPGSDDRYSYDCEWKLESPINPENIASVYIDDICLYDYTEQ